MPTIEERVANLECLVAHFQALRISEENRAPAPTPTITITSTPTTISELPSTTAIGTLAEASSPTSPHTTLLDLLEAWNNNDCKRRENIKNYISNAPRQPTFQEVLAVALRMRDEENRIHDDFDRLWDEENSEDDDEDDTTHVRSPQTTSTNQPRSTTPSNSESQTDEAAEPSPTQTNLPSAPQTYGDVRVVQFSDNGGNLRISDQ
jgi:hypothetical protein